MITYSPSDYTSTTSSQFFLNSPPSSHTFPPILDIKVNVNKDTCKPIERDVRKLVVSAQVVSDLHLELYDTSDLTKLPIPKPIAPLLIMAGDIYPGRKENFKEVMSYITSFYDAVVFVPGNHEYYCGDGINMTIDEIKDKMKKECESIPKMYYLDDDVISINGITFLGGTMWTKIFYSYWPVVKSFINDYNAIAYQRYGKVLKLSPEIVDSMHKETLKFFRSEIRSITSQSNAGTTCENVVVITHHSPSFKYKGTWFRNDIYKEFYFADDVDDLLVKPPVCAWFHGHTHCTVNSLSDGGTSIISNARGYESELNQNYDEKMVVNIYDDGVVSISL
jgi:hypothetical protein